MLRNLFVKLQGRKENRSKILDELNGKKRSITNPARTSQMCFCVVEVLSVLLLKRDFKKSMKLLTIFVWSYFCLIAFARLEISDSYINCGQKSLTNQIDIAQSTVVKPQTKLTYLKCGDLNGKSNEATDKQMSLQRYKAHWL